MILTFALQVYATRRLRTFDMAFPYDHIDTMEDIPLDEDTGLRDKLSQMALNRKKPEGDKVPEK